MVLATAFITAVLGDSLGSCIGFKGGHRLILRLGQHIGFGAVQIGRMNQMFVRYRGWLVAFARFFEVLRQVNGFVAGTAEMPFWRFLPFNAAGAMLWIGVWGLGSFRLGRTLIAYANHTSTRQVRSEGQPNHAGNRAGDPRVTERFHTG